MRKGFILAMIGIIACAAVSGQGTLKGKILDSTSKLGLGYATVTVFKASDTSIITYRLSTPDGDFRVPGLPTDMNCRVLVSYSGYAVFRKEFTIPAGQGTMDIGTITMAPNSKSLDEVMVIAERPPVVYKKDTIEFNASAFKTLPNALVEDLLKKLPGVQVDRDGNINVNGKPVNRILVDGKVFFGDDPKMATRNLPANVIDKVQVVDDKEQMLRNGDDNLNNVGKVVNITLKKGVKKGWFGKVYAGLGTSSLYEAGGIANIYRDTLQISVLGYMNNMNKAGFSFNELMQTGGMDRTRSNLQSNSTSIWTNASGGSGISINGVNFGGAQSYGGVSTSKGGGFNLNHAPNAKRSIYAQYFRGNIHIDRESNTDSKQFVGDTVISNNTNLGGDVITNGHNIALGARLKPDSVTNILVNLNYTLGESDEDRINDIYSNNSELGNLSNGNIFQNNLGTTRYYRHTFSITKLSRSKKGRRFTVTHNLDINNRFNELYTESSLHFLYPAIFDSLNSQLRRERIPRTDANLTANFSEPLSKHWTFRVTGRYEYSKLNNNINTFNKNGGNEYNVPNALLSSDFERVSNRGYISSGLEYKWKDFTITPTVRWLVQDVDNNLASLPKSIVQKRSDLLPGINIVYKQANLSYSKDIALPSYNNLIPVQDNTNTYFITKGNPYLQPMVRQNFGVNYWFNNPKKNFNANVYVNGSLTDNDVVQSIVVDQRGVQTTSPVNADGSRSFYVNMNFYKQYKNNPKFIFSWNTGNNVNYNKSRLFFNNIDSWQSTYSMGEWFGVNLNWNDKLEWNSNYSINYNFTRYTSTQFKKLEVVSHYVDNELILRWPKHIIWETQVNYTYNSSISNGAPKGVVRWNAGINLTMLNDETGVLKFTMFDLLNKNNNISVFANRNMVSTFRTNTLSRYFMLTFTYNVRAAGAKKRIGGRERLFFF